MKSAEKQSFYGLLQSRIEDLLSKHTGYKVGTFVVCVLDLKTHDFSLQVLPSLDSATDSMDRDEIMVWHRIMDFGTPTSLSAPACAGLMSQLEDVGVFSVPNSTTQTPSSSREKEALDLLQYRLDPSFENLTPARQMLWRTLATNLLRDHAVEKKEHPFENNPKRSVF